MDWYNVWPDKALLQVAKHFLGDLEMPDDKCRNHVEELCLQFHRSALNLIRIIFEEQGRKLYVTPSSYMELINTFRRLSILKRSDVARSRDRFVHCHSPLTIKVCFDGHEILMVSYLTGLDKLERAQSDVARMQITLSELQPQLILATQETEQIMKELEVDAKHAHLTRLTVQEEEASASKKAEAAKAIKDECEADLAEAMPALMGALAALDTLKQADITVMKSMKSPPAGF